MPASPEELETALKLFRQDILKALANLDVEILALQDAVLEGKPVSRKRLNELRAKARESHGRFVDRQAQSISFAHEIR